ncbi:hypothetical protein [uncultured Alsobacter sp.]|uniref:hypothetical protein n=1 Tax=uncultured Alsobacter sp. TaxID=1748258 RepID=UPI0025DD3453|nr:hypothetical protein [uncultured Alsobacter sp.]
MPMRPLALAAILLTLTSASLPARAQHAHHGMPMPAATAPREAGQSAFAAIQEIVALLEADPKTDWSKVDIEALRAHLVDMDAVTLRSRVAAEPIEGGARFVVTGDGEVSSSIRRMVQAHAAAMDGTGGWRLVAEDRPDGAVLAVSSRLPSDVAKIRALGFIGLMTRGMHHQQHHLMLARGMNPHR